MRWKKDHQRGLVYGLLFWLLLFAASVDVANHGCIPFGVMCDERGLVPVERPLD